MSSKIKCVIFDFSGTLVDSITPGIEILEEFAHKYGKTISDKIKTNLAETESMDSQFESILSQLNLDKVIDFDVAKKVLLKRYLEKGIKFYPGVEKLLEHLHSNGIPMAIATNLKSNEFNLFASIVPGFDPAHFSHIVCGGDDPDVKDNKPAPDVFLVCLKRFKNVAHNLNNCLIFEDSIIGLKGAVASGMRTVLVDNKMNVNTRKLFEGSVTLIDTFDKLAPEDLGLPAY